MEIGDDNLPVEGSVVRLTADVNADNTLPVWSPDGTMVAYQSKQEGGEYQVFVMDRDGNTKRRISDGRGFAGQPYWSPDGKSVVYVAGERAEAAVPKEIMVAGIDGGEPRAILSRGTSLRRPLWTGDGRHIVCVEGPGERNQALVVINAEGGGVRVLADSAQAPQVSPTGDKVTYYAVDSRLGSDVFVVQIAEGSAPTNITELSPEDYYPAWSPDGKRLTWSSTLSLGSHKIVVANMDGSESLQVSSGEGDDFQPLWSPPAR
jgi:TolB protein